ncbi:YceI family protein [Pseudohongiella spirulinae]|uniref:Lipid/polyisoprenoid-binding YceI-like domain-containing protein n=1 Tax=Pseudohongiella spirulinae TaxID=1249552 RepID=A0A0S2KC57_9GAMM|nr:YceI family protein [Pseudohongiella spirulinae]ALO45599.1 hypothetical protein PS2015_929 [Pseudohongiella spirulinae]
MRKKILGAAIAPLLMASSLSANAATWVMDPEDSSVVFKYSYSGTPYEGEFRNVEAVFEIDPLSPGDCKFEVTIPIIDTYVDDEETLSYLLDVELFDVDQFPYARFEATQCRLEAGSAFVADGMLTIRDQTQPISFPFDLNVNIDGGLRFNLTSEVTIQRLDYGVGLGYWANTSAIPNEVTIAVDVYAVKQ